MHTTNLINRDCFETEAQLGGYAERSCITDCGLLSIESRSEIGTRKPFRRRGKRLAHCSRLSKIAMRRLWKGYSEQTRK